MAGFSGAMKNFCQLEQLAEGHTCIHRLHPLTKLVVTLVYVVVVISFPIHAPFALTPMALYPFLLMALSETPWRPLLRRMALALPFVMLTGASNLLLDRDVAFFLAGLPVTLGLLSCISLLLKTFLTLTAALLLVSTTSLLQLSDQLIRLRVPRPLCLQLILTYRYISVLLGEVGRMYTAYRLRSAGDRGVKICDMGSFLGQLLLRSWDRAERVYCAMKCRGYDGTYRAGDARAFTAGNALLTLIVCAAILLPQFFHFLAGR